MQDDAVQTRPAVPADARALAEIHVSSWQATYRGLMPDSVLDVLLVEEREGTWRERLEAPTTETLVLEVNGRMLGWATSGPARDSDVDAKAVIELYGIYLLPSAWRGGLGRLLYLAVEARIQSQLDSKIILWVLDGNARARRFYEAMGFTEEPDRTKVTELGGAGLPHQRYEKTLASGHTREGFRP